MVVKRTDTETLKDCSVQILQQEHNNGMADYTTIPTHYIETYQLTEPESVETIFLASKLAYYSYTAG